VRKGADVKRTIQNRHNNQPFSHNVNAKVLLILIQITRIRSKYVKIQPVNVNLGAFLSSLSFGARSDSIFKSATCLLSTLANFTNVFSLQSHKHFFDDCTKWRGMRKSHGWHGVAFAPRRTWQTVARTNRPHNNAKRAARAVL